MRRLTLLLAVAAVLLPSLATAAEPTVYDTISKHYEAIRMILLHDSSDGVAPHAEEIATVATRAAGAFDAARHGVDAASADRLRELLPELAKAAGQVAAAGDLAATREAFFPLSQALPKLTTSAARATLFFLP